MENCTASYNVKGVMSLCSCQEAVIEGDLRLKDCNIQMPHSLHIKGNLALENCYCTGTPYELTVDGNISIFDCKFQSLAKSVIVKNNIFLYNSSILENPCNLIVGETLTYSYNKAVSIKLPEQAKVKHLYLDNVIIDKIPDNLIIEKDLYVINSTIENLDNIKRVNGNFTLSNCKIDKLSDNLIVTKLLDLTNSSIKELPRGLKVGGDLLLRRTNVKELPNDLITGGSLYLRESKVESIPKNFIIGGSLYYCTSTIEELPNDLITGDTVNLEILKDSCVDYSEEKRICLKNGDIIKNGKWIYITTLTGGMLTGHLYPIRKIKHTKNYTLYYGEIKDNIISNGKDYAVCEDWHDGVMDLCYKKLMLNKKYDDVFSIDLNIDSVISFEDAILLYKKITRACDNGIKDFIKHMETIKSEYTIREIIELTKGYFGNQYFTEFFLNR